MNGPFGNMFPYTNFHEMNLDWVIQIAKDFLDQYTHIETLIQEGEDTIQGKTDHSVEVLEAKKVEIEGLLNSWYTDHSEDIAGELADALEDLNAWYTEHSEDIAGELAQAITDFDTAADAKAALAISTIPGDYSEVAAQALAAIKGVGTMISNSTTLDTYTNNTKSAKNFPINSIVMVGQTNIGLLDYPDQIPPYSGTGTYITYCDSLGVTRGIVQLYISAYGGMMAYRYKYGTGSEFTNWMTPIQGQNLMIINEEGLSTLTKTTKSVLNFPINTIQLIGTSGSSINMVDFPGECDGRGTYITTGFSVRSDGFGKTILYIDPYGRMYTNFYYNDTHGWAGWRLVSENKCYVNCPFPNAEAGFTSEYDLVAGQTYYMKTNIASNVNSIKRFNVFVENHSEEYVSVFDSYVKYTPSNSGKLRVANRNSYTGTMILEVRPDTPENRLVWETPREYHVDASGTVTDQTNLTDLILSFVKGYDPDHEDDSTYLWQDESPKVIYIHSGTYNIFNEYVAETQEASPRLHPMSDIPADQPAQKWFGKYNAIIPPNTKLIGVGDVILQFTPTTSEIGEGASKTWSPLNVKSEVYVENITILAKNCRYGIHDDPGTGKYGNTKHIYKNVKVNYIEDSTSFGRLNTLGFGFNQNGYYLFEDCEFRYDGSHAHGVFYGHDSGVGHATIIIKDCIIESNNSSESKAVRLQTIQSTSTNPSHNFVRIDNSYLAYGLNYDLYSTTALQAFEVVALHSGNPSITTTKPSGNTTENPYPAQIYN